MTKETPHRRPAGPKTVRRAARTERLSAALKSNLRRRKVQARAREAEAADTGEPAAPHESAGIVDEKQSG
jgi:hypothetical protein